MKREVEEKEVLDRQQIDEAPSFRKLFKSLQQQMSAPKDEKTVYGQERYINSEDDMGEPIDYENSMNVKLCGHGIGHCDENEHCRLISREGGICKCNEGYYSRKKSALNEELFQSCRRRWSKTFRPGH